MSDFPDSLVNSSKTFEIGVALGMSGVVIKHLTGLYVRLKNIPLYLEKKSIFYLQI
jgi:hypothetical protein